MPYRPPKPCRFVGCAELTHERYCERHKKQTDSEYNRFNRDRDSQKFYESKQWRQLRRVQLNRQPICEDCKKVVATVVDHIVPIKQDGAALDLENLQSLCVCCHSRKSVKESSRFGKR